MSLAQVCRADYERHCHDVQPGGGRIIKNRTVVIAVRDNLVKGSAGRRFRT